MSRRFNQHVQLIQTDGGSEFKDDFKAHVSDYCERYRIARPYKTSSPTLRASSTFRKECLAWGKYRREEMPELIPVVESFLDRYHYHRPHLAFEPMRPPLKKR